MWILLVTLCSISFGKLVEEGLLGDAGRGGRRSAPGP